MRSGSPENPQRLMKAPPALSLHPLGPPTCLVGVLKGVGDTHGCPQELRGARGALGLPFPCGFSPGFSRKCIKDKKVPIGVTVVVAVLLLTIIALAGKWLRPPKSSPPPEPTHRSGSLGRVLLISSQEMSLLPILPLSRPSQLPRTRHRLRGEVLLLCGGRSGLEQESDLLLFPQSPFGHHRHPGRAGKCKIPEGLGVTGFWEPVWDSVEAVAGR